MSIDIAPKDRSTFGPKGGHITTVATRPKTTLRTAPGEATEPTNPYQRIVVALDGSALAEEVLTYVVPLANAFDSTVTCICAAQPINPVLAGESSLEPVMNCWEGP